MEGSVSVDYIASVYNGGDGVGFCLLGYGSCFGFDLGRVAHLGEGGEQLLESGVVTSDDGAVNGAVTVVGNIDDACHSFEKDSIFLTRHRLKLTTFNRIELNHSAVSTQIRDELELSQV